MKSTMCTGTCGERRYFIGGSDARIVMGHDEGALLRLWREKRGEVEAEDLSDNLIVQLGTVTESGGPGKTLDGGNARRNGRGHRRRL